MRSSPLIRNAENIASRVKIMRPARGNYPARFNCCRHKTLYLSLSLSLTICTVRSPTTGVGLATGSISVIGKPTATELIKAIDSNERGCVCKLFHGNVYFAP